MSKHLGNVVDPWDILDKYGADAVRWYFYTAGAPWLPSRFYEDAVSEGQRKYMSTLWNTYAFYILYANIDEFIPAEYPLETLNLTLMDKWIISRLNETIKVVDEGLNSIKIPESAMALQKLTDDLSNWYVRRSRSRFWGQGMDEDKQAAFATLYHVLYNITLLTAPFTPFMAEAIYQNIVRSVYSTAPESVHLCDFPQYDESLIDSDKTRQMADLIEVVQLGRACRNLASIKVRQPLSEMLIRGTTFSEEYSELAKDELNIKEISFVDDSDAFMDYKLKPQLKTLGPRFGKELNVVRTILENTDGNAAVKGFENGKELVITVNGREEKLTQDDVLIETAQKEGLISQEDGGITVALVTTISNELRLEGMARELISKLQTMRKDAGFEVIDRINVYYTGDDEIRNAFDIFGDLISSVVLAVDIKAGEAPQGAYSESWDINGHEAILAVIKR
jgi:isoleucyl-tRNA synthetase